MDYGDAYFHKELAQPESSTRVSTRASRAANRDEKPSDLPVVPVAKKAKVVKKANAVSEEFSEFDMIVDVSLREDYRKTLTKELGHKVICVQPDHNCLFRALAHLLDGDGRAHEDVRRLICDELEADDGERYSTIFTPNVGEFKNDASFTAYLERMRRVNEWGGNLELAAAAVKFGFKIHVHHLFNPTIVIESAEELLNEREVHLAYYGDHYDVVSPIPDSNESQLGKRAGREEPEGDNGIVVGTRSASRDGDGTKKSKTEPGPTKIWAESRDGSRRLSSHSSNDSTMPPLARPGSSRAHGQGLSATKR
jgi:hypothetical protein